MADYFEHVQLAVVFADLVPSGGDHLGPSLAINVDNFTLEEMRMVLKALPTGKAPGGDGAPPEF